MLDRFQQSVLEMIARGRPLQETADRICRDAESLATGTICSILTVDRAGLLHPLAGPSLPSHYSAALDGVKIGPSVGSCGTAAFRQEPVSVVDISRDPLWSEFRDLAAPLGIRACWSSPIANESRVLGTFAFYFSQCRGPSENEKHIVAACVDLCSILLEREETRAENNRLAYFDVLTQLGNRASFNEAVDLASGAQEGVGLLLIDVDRLKHVNDTLGHAAGDDLIREVGLRIAEAAAPKAAFRVGGDEFAVLLSGGSAAAELSDIAERLLLSTRRSARCAGHVIAPAVTCGGAVSNKPESAASLRRQADLALYHAKENARGSLVIYDEHLATTIAKRLKNLQCVAAALAEDRILAYYQPIVRLDTREIVGLEALCRIREPDGGILAAWQFADAMQDLSVGRLVTDRILAQVAVDIRTWLDLGIPIQHVGVNVTTADFQNSDLRQRLSTAFSRHGVPLEHLILEVTESVFMSETDHKVAAEVDRLRAEGLRVALDDFGTGYASLTHLLNFPVDIIKIDKSFVDRSSSGSRGQVIVKAILEMALGLGLRVVAEGVECEEQADRLDGLGCKLAQGYLFGRPDSREATTKVLLSFAQRLTGRRRSALATSAA